MFLRKIDYKSFIGDKQFYYLAAKLMIPVITAAVLGALATMLDTLMISSFMNQHATNGLGLANSINQVFNFLLQGLGVAVGIFCAQYFGSKNYQELKQTVSFGIITGLIIGVIISIIYFFASSAILHFMVSSNDVDANTINDNDIFRYGKDYLNILTYIWPMTAITTVMYSVINQSGQTKYTLIISFFGVLVNALLNPLFIAGYWGFPQWGVEGAGIATLIGKVTEVILIIIFLAIKRPIYLPQTKFWKIKAWVIQHVSLSFLFAATSSVSLGIAYSAATIVFNKYGSTSILNGQIINNSYSGVIAAFAIINIFTAVLNGFGPVVGYFIGRELGQDNFIKAKENARKILFFGAIISFIIAFIIFILSFFIIDITFQSYTQEAKDYAKYMLKLQFFSYFALALANIVFNILRAGNKTGVAMIIDITCTWLFVFTFTLIAFKYFHFNDYQTGLVFSIGDGLQLIVVYVVYRNITWARDIVSHKAHKKAKKLEKSKKH